MRESSALQSTRPWDMRHASLFRVPLTASADSTYQKTPVPSTPDDVPCALFKEVRRRQFMRGSASSFDELEGGRLPEKRLKGVTKLFCLIFCIKQALLVCAATRLILERCPLFSNTR